jgi:hypothetical protein
MEEEREHASARMRELYAKYGVREEEAQPAIIETQNDEKVSDPAIETNEKLEEQRKKRRSFRFPFGKRKDSVTEELKPKIDSTGTGTNDGVKIEPAKSRRGLFNSREKNPQSKPKRSALPGLCR